MKKWIFSLLLSSSLLAAPPAWWSDPYTAILIPGATPAPKAIATQAQLKFVAKQSAKYLNQVLPPPGAGAKINAMVAGFHPSPKDKTVVSLATLKAVSKLYFDRLLEIGYPTKANLITHGYPANWPYPYPWNPATPRIRNLTPACLAQLKICYAFDLEGFTIVDSNANLIPDAWEIINHLNLGGGNDDSDSDNISDLGEYLAGTNPNNSDENQNGIPDGSEDVDGDSIPASEEALLGTDSKSREWLPRYAAIQIAEDTADPCYQWLTNQGIAVNGLATIWKEGSESSLGEGYVGDVSSNGKVGFNPKGPQDSDFGIPQIIDLTDNSTRTLGHWTDAEIKSLDKTIPANAYGFSVVSRSGYVSAVAPNGLAAGWVWATDHYWHPNPQPGQPPIESYGGVGGLVYWDANSQIHSINTDLGLGDDQAYVQTAVHAVRAINSNGKMLGELNEFHPDYIDGTPILWTNLSAAPQILSEYVNAGNLNEAGDYAGGRNNDTGKFQSSSSYELGKAHKFSLFKIDNLQVTVPKANGGTEQKPYPRIAGNREWLSNGEATVWIKSIDKNAYVAVDINKRINWPTGSQKQVISVTALNDKGLMLGTTEEPGQSGVSYGLFLPCDLAVDANRDGIIKFGATLSDSDPLNLPDLTSQDKPFRIWVNDDQDDNAATQPNDDAETVPTINKDSADNLINTKRDLEDFSRLHINIDGLQDAIANGTIEVGLEWRNVMGNPSIKIYQAAEADGGDQYLKTEIGAANQQMGSFGTALGTISVGSSFKFQTFFWQSNLMGLSIFDANHPNRYIIFEGVTEGKGQLVLTFWKDGQKIGEGGGVWIDLVNVKKMFLRVKATGIADNAPEPSDDNNNQPSEPSMSWEQDDNGQPYDANAEKSYTETKQCIVFVHGWNMSYEGSENFAETMFKRLWQRGYKGRFAFMRWPTLDDGFGIGNFQIPCTYNASEYRAWKSGESLKQFVNSLPAGYTKNVIAHSMGNIVVGSALQKGMSVTNYAMLNAAVPAACYDDSSSLDQGWGYTTPHYDPDSGTRNLSYRYKFNSVVGNLINFYLPLDSALSLWEINNSTSGPFSFGAKPQRYNGSSTGYYYAPGAPIGQRLGITYFSVNGRFVSTPHEAMAYVAQSPTKAAGAEGNTAGSIRNKVNLASYGFASVHSAEFNFTIYYTKSFYDRLMTGFQLLPNP